VQAAPSGGWGGTREHEDGRGGAGGDAVLALQVKDQRGEEQLVVEPLHEVHQREAAHGHVPAARAVVVLRGVAQQVDDVAHGVQHLAHHLLATLVCVRVSGAALDS
jgi:hypothetical protein